MQPGSTFSIRKASQSIANLLKIATVDRILTLERGIHGKDCLRR
jgi:hypothetical protein